MQDEFTQLASMKMMFSVINTCYKDCVNDFRSEQLTANEKTCVTNCTKRSGAAFESMSRMQGQIENRARQF